MLKFAMVILLVSSSCVSETGPVPVERPACDSGLRSVYISDCLDGRSGICRGATGDVMFTGCTLLLGNGSSIECEMSCE